MEGIDLWLVMSAALLGSASPGPSNMMIASTAIAEGRARALILAAGILTGSLFWSASAAMGFGAVMYANAWLIETIRYCGAAYLLYLGYRSARSALSPAMAKLAPPVEDGGSRARLYLKGLALHLTNPKAILFLGSLYAIGIPKGTPASALATLVLLIGLQSALVFLGYALFFSSARAVRGYLRMRRSFDAVFAAFFAFAGIKVLTARL